MSFGALCYFLCLLKVHCAWIFICVAAFIGFGVVTGTKGTAAVSDLHSVRHCRRLLIKTLTGREEWTLAKNRGMTIG